VKATHEFTRFTGNLHVYGSVTLTAEPSDSFSFASRVEWPCRDPELFDAAVRRGIEHALSESAAATTPSFHVELTKIVWRERESVALAYEFAAAQAMRDVLRDATNVA